MLIHLYSGSTDTIIATKAQYLRLGMLIAVITVNNKLWKLRHTQHTDTKGDDDEATSESTKHAKPA